MGLFENIDKLINERGSANILRERLLLADDKYSAMEKKNAEFQSENAILKSNIQKLESENQRLRFDNEQLKTQIKTLLIKQLYQINPYSGLHDSVALRFRAEEQDYYESTVSLKKSKFKNSA